MRQFWKTDKCYKKDHGVNGSICSFIVYLSEVGIFKCLLNYDRVYGFLRTSYINNRLHFPIVYWCNNPCGILEEHKKRV